VNIKWKSSSSNNRALC